MISSLRLQHFRSYTDALFEVGPFTNIVVGPNASGKTNLLEAILVATQGVSYRVKDTELIQHNEEWARIDVVGREENRILKLTRDPPSKKFEINDRQFLRLTPKYKRPVILFEPNHLLLLGGPPDARRLWVDDMLEQIVPRFGDYRRQYKRILSQRNALLKKNPPNLKEQLFVWNIRLSELGATIVRERSKHVETINKTISDLYSAIAQEKTRIELVYISQFPTALYETQLLHKLEQSIDLDVLRGFTASGPHRDDIHVFIHGRPVQENASRGETRTLLLSLKIQELQLLEATYQTKPIILLDDVFSELDSKRRTALINFIANHQTFITTTDADLITQHIVHSNIIALSRTSRGMS